MRDNNPMIGLVVAVLAVIVLPASVQIYRALTPRLAHAGQALPGSSRRSKETVGEPAVIRGPSARGSGR